MLGKLQSVSGLAGWWGSRPATEDSRRLQSGASTRENKCSVIVLCHRASLVCLTCQFHLAFIQTEHDIYIKFGIPIPLFPWKSYYILIVLNF